MADYIIGELKKMAFGRGFGILSACLLSLSACGDLPRGAAMRSEILNTPANEVADFTVYTVDRGFLNKVKRWPTTGGIATNGWIAHKHVAGGPLIAVGDKVSLAIWDSEENSLISAPGQKTVNMNDLTVSSDGTIFVPYIDTVTIEGLGANAARMLIQEEMESIIPAAQVQLVVKSGRKNAVDLVGGVARAGVYPLTDEHTTVLNLVSLGSGIPPSLRNPQVRLIRNGRVYMASVARLYGNPALDTVLQGGDKVIIEQDTRYFLSLGAAGSERLIYFEKDKISALEAISIMGGISDLRADPQGILILRDYPAHAVRTDDKGPSKDRVVFSIDLTNADGLFSARQFQINPNDVVLVTESPAATTAVVFDLMNTGLTAAKKIKGF